MSGLIELMGPKAVNLNGAGGGTADLTPADIAAALSYLNLSRFEDRYLRARILQSEAWHRTSDLAYDAWDWAIGIQIANGWEIPRGQEIYRKLAFVAVDVRINPEKLICPGCKGRGFYKPKQSNHLACCGRCEGKRTDKTTGMEIGNGRRRVSARKYAEALGITHNTFLATWESRLQVLTSGLIEIEHKARYLIGVIEDCGDTV